MKKVTGFKTKGMNRDLSVSAFNPEFSFENRNLRLSTNESNTLMSWVNERGTATVSLVEMDNEGNIKRDAQQKEITFNIAGTPIGTAVINHKLVLFTHNEGNESPDHIYKLEAAPNVSNKMKGIELFSGNLNFSVEYPLETLVAYEAEHIQKVYWTDGLNQPRLINIEATPEKRKKWEGNSFAFDFVPTVQMKEEVVIKKNISAGGLFAPGVIQYAFTYVNKYGQQSNLVYVSSLFYLTYNDRGASAEDKVTSSFEITIQNPDPNFDYIRLYSIQRTSLDADIFAKHLDDLPVNTYEEDGEVKTKEIFYLDNGTVGATIDPYELLYIGGKEITAATIADKEKTLFLGNIEQKNLLVDKIQECFDAKRESTVETDHVNISYKQDDNKKLDLSLPTAYYAYDNEMAMGEGTTIKDITTFKGGETYRFGFQLQTKTGEWTEPIFLDDKENNLYPLVTVSADTNTNEVKLVYAEGDIDLRIFTQKTIEQEGQQVNNPYYIKDFASTYVKARPVMVYPTINDRTVLCQGVANPTVFNVLDRKTNSPFSQASWFFRPYMLDGMKVPSQNYNGLRIDVIELLKDVDKSQIQPITLINNIDETYNRPDQRYFHQEGDADKCIDCYVTFMRVGMGNDGIYDFNTNKVFPKKLRWKNNTEGVFPEDVGGGTTPGTTTSGDVDVYAAIYLGYTDITSNSTLISWGYNDTMSQEFFWQGRDVDYWGRPSPQLYAIITREPFIPPTEGVNRLYVVDFQGLEYSTASPFGDGTDFILASEVLGQNQAFKINGTLKFKEMTVPISSFETQTVVSTFAYYDDANDQAPDVYVFEFFKYDDQVNASGDYYNRKHYRIIFHNQHNAGSVNNVVSDGSVLRYDHYNSIYNTSDIGSSQTTFNDIVKQIEIQGAINVYDSPFDLNKANVNANTQYIIDQSILTLNSPDIEYDTEVQLFSNSNLKMRVVGAIPITSNVSSHLINGSSMVEYNNNGTYVFGQGDTGKNIGYKGIVYEGGNRLVAEYLWNDVSVSGSGTADGAPMSFLVHPWNRTGSLNNDKRKESEAVSKLQKKVFANLLYSVNTDYLDSNYPEYNIGLQYHLQENEEVMNYRLPRQKEDSEDINYYANIDKVLYNEQSYDLYAENNQRKGTVNSPVSMKYKSNTHAVIDLMSVIENNETLVPILPYANTFKMELNNAGEKVLVENPVNIGDYPVDTEGYKGKTFWDEDIHFTQEGVDFTEEYQVEEEGQTVTKRRQKMFWGNPQNFLWLCEIYKIPTKRFGGTSKDAIRANKWQVCGDTVDIKTDAATSLTWTVGDTYYQRYDCLKTYPFTQEDTNQIVEILSFMCETHINIDGRWDRNRGQTDNTMMSPVNFGGLAHLNPVYSQKDNFFTQRRTDTEDYKNMKYPNQIVFTKTKESGADVDLWTNITLSSPLEMDGDKGEVTAIRRLNDQLICFQDSGISQILYNENVQVASTAGVPIEIANSGKVQGKRYYSNSVGCSNKWSIVQTPAGIYFMDSNEKVIYRLGSDGLQNISQQGGFNSWCKQNIPSTESKWNSENFENFVGYYDRLNQDVLFINQSEALAFSEKLGVFTSFYDYGNTPWLCNLDDIGIWIDKNSNLWQHQAGEYCNFFGTPKPYSMTLVGNPEPQIDKIFTNLEFRACVDGDGEQTNAGKFAFSLPFDSLEVWNEYQHGVTSLEQKSGHEAMQHGGSSSSLKRKFRIWRCDIPRDNVSFPVVHDLPEHPTEEEIAEHDAEITALNNFISEESKKGIYRKKAHPIDRMRNPWLYLKLQKDADTDKKVEIHDMMMTYFG